MRPLQFPVAEQASNIDEVPVQNRHSYFGADVSAVSRRKLFKGTPHLRVVRVERETKGPAEGKAAQMIQQEASKHKLLGNLKTEGGPFDSVIYWYPAPPEHWI